MKEKINKRKLIEQYLDLRKGFAAIGVKNPMPHIRFANQQMPEKDLEVIGRAMCGAPNKECAARLPMLRTILDSLTKEHNKNAAKIKK